MKTSFQRKVERQHQREKVAQGKQLRACNWHGIMAAFAPGMAAGNAVQRQVATSAAPCCAAPDGINRTGGLKTAGTPAEPGLNKDGSRDQAISSIQIRLHGRRRAVGGPCRAGQLAGLQPKRKQCCNSARTPPSAHRMWR